MVDILWNKMSNASSATQSPFTPLKRPDDDIRVDLLLPHSHVKQAIVL